MRFDKLTTKLQAALANAQSLAETLAKNRYSAWKQPAYEVQVCEAVSKPVN